MSKAILYLRQSTDKQSESPETQRETCMRLCQQNGWEVVDTFHDDAISGKSTKNRPQLEAALQRVCADKCILVAYSLSRIARSTRDAIDIFDRIHAAEAEIALAKEKLDTTGPFGRFMFRMLASLSELERELIGERTRDAMSRKRAKGERVGRHAPFGKRLEDGKLVDEIWEANIIGAIKVMAQDKWGIEAISDNLNQSNLTYRGRKWVPGLVRRVLEQQGCKTH